VTQRARAVSVGGMLSRVLAAVAVSLLVLVVAPAQAATPSQTYQRKIVVATNAARAHHELPELKRQQCVQRFAVRQAVRMANQQRMFHQDLGPVLSECGLSAVGENVAYGFPTGRAVVRGWMRSEGHRANILSSSYRLLGAGARKADNGQWYAAQVFGRR